MTFRVADNIAQTQDNYGAVAQFSPLPTTSNTTAPKIAAAFAGLVLAGIILLVILQLRKRGNDVAATPVRGREQVTTR